MTRQEFEAIIKEVNEAKCCSVHAVEEECNLFFKAKPKCVKEGLDVDKHRWYEITTNVYAIDEWFLGIRGPSDLFSESSSFDDLYVETAAIEMKEVQTVTYTELKKIKEKENELSTDKG